MRTLVVTGGARGIGAACARLAARDGWRVVVNYKGAVATAEAVVAAIRAEGGTALALQGDMSREADVAGLFAAAEAALGPIGGLVNNAGILERTSRLADIGLPRWEQVFATNTTGAFLAAREALRCMIRAGQGGAIVNLSSMAAALGAPGEAVDYAASKGAVEAMTVGLAKEVAGQGIRVNAVRPGLIDTDMQKSTGEADRLGRLMATVPMGRAGRADEVAEAVVWLLSDKASYVTGAILPVSGGR